jgi:serine/threonine protein kinase
LSNILFPLTQISLIGKKGNYHFTPEDKNSVLRANGKYSIIYRGNRVEDGRIVLIKMLHPKWNTNQNERKRLVKEFTSAPDSYRDDEVFPEMMDICERENNLYIIREFIDGVDLSSYRNNKSIFSLVKKEGKKKIVLKILDAFIRLHEHKIIHGDIKPSNIMLTIAGDELKVKIIDFGLSIPFHHHLKREKENPLPFSLIYASPELMLNYPESIFPATDIYSLALTIYEFLSDEKPFEVTNPAIMMSLQLNQPLEKNSKINSATLDVLNKASLKFNFKKPIQNYPSDYVLRWLRSAVICRYQTMQEFKEALEISLEKKDGIWKRYFGN